MSRELGQQREGQVLTLTGRIGFITAELAAAWVWPTSAHGRKLAEALLRRLVKAGLLIRREIRGRAAAYVLTAAGARELGPDERPGTGWGRVVRGQPWGPPVSFDHDLRAARFLLSIDRGKYQVAFDHEIRRRNPDREKYPDGLIFHEGRGWWIEVEQARKNGSDVRRQARWIVDLQEMPESWTTPFGSVRASKVIVVLPPNGHQDRRGYEIDHRKTLAGSLVKALDEAGAAEVRVTWVRELAAGGFGQPEPETIKGSPA